MANQTHLLFGGGGVGSDDGAAPRAHDVVKGARLLRNWMVLFSQHNLLRSSPDTNLVPVTSVLT